MSAEIMRCLRVKSGESNWSRVLLTVEFSEGGQSGSELSTINGDEYFLNNSDLGPISVNAVTNPDQACIVLLNEVRLASARSDQKATR